MSGSLTLATSGQRRLFAYLMRQDHAAVAHGDEKLFSGLISAWTNVDADPASIETTENQEAIKDVWRLDRIEASGFGGLTLYGGPQFELRVNEKNWCLNGQNGSGKTSIASAILWALTGQRIREQDGPIEERGERSPVISETGHKFGSWPSIASYPTEPEKLGQTVEVWVRLTFVNQNGDPASAFRRIVCPPNSEPTIDVAVDPRLVSIPQLLEAGLLMPARLARIGFGEKSSSLYDAVKMLTGLDQLSDIAEGCGHFTHGGRRFLKYGKDNGIDLWRSKFTEEMANAVGKAEQIQFTLPDSCQLGGVTLVEDLKRSAVSASDQAESHFEALKSDIAPSIDTSKSEGRKTVQAAVAAARIIVQQGAKGIEVFEAWNALEDAAHDAKWSKIPEALGEARVKLDLALKWHAMQMADRKFRLKALAAQYFVPPHEHSDSVRCPLCEGLLTTDEQKEIGTQLAALRKDADEAEQKLDDVCRRLKSELAQYLPAGMKRHQELLDTMEPRKGYGIAARDRFCGQPPFDNVLLELSRRNKSKIEAQEAALPEFEFPELKAVWDEEPEPAIRLRRNLHSLDRLWMLVAWWSEHREVFLTAFTELIGTKQEDGNFLPSTLGGELQVLEEALSRAAPADELSKALLGAASAAEKWARIQAAQNLRKEIADALKPIKDLRLLVAAETARSIVGLSGRIEEILDRIHLRERLAYEGTSLGKRVVHVGGSFAPGMQIDAALVANSSWLRAILWAFIFALREETIEGVGVNPFPLMVLDDLQTSFDPRNKRKWAQELARLANMDSTSHQGLQLFLTTHERQFFQCMVDVERLKGEQGLIGGVNSTAGVVTIVNSGWLQKTWQEANDHNDDSLARDYISDVRIYCEDLLKFMLRGEGPEIPNQNLFSLTRKLRSLHDSHVPPFDRKAFTDLLNTCGGGGGRPMNLINETHHKDDESIGLAQACEVKEFWEKTLMDQIHQAFAVYDRYESFYGEPRTFPWTKTVVDFPNGFRDELGEITLQHSGIAAAASTDGRAGDGVITVAEWDAASAIVLPNHELFQLAAGTLEPVASLGDLVIVCNHAKVSPRNLVIAAHGDELLARRYNEMDEHPEVAVLTGEAIDPYSLPQPLIIAPDTAELRKIVGTLFAAHNLPVPVRNPKSEIVPLKDLAIPRRMLQRARLFKVEGRSAEPIALEGQFLITSDVDIGIEDVRALDGRLVVAIDEDGVRYFKRLRCKNEFVILENLSQDGMTASELLSIDENGGLSRLHCVREVIGVLFEVSG